MNKRLATIALTTFSACILLIQTASAQIVAPERFVQIRSINLTTSVLELYNSGTTSQSLASWRFCTHDEDQVRRYSSSSGLNNFTLTGGQSLYVHFNNDADPANAQAVNISTIGGGFALPLDADGAYGAQIYFNSSFGSGASIADHIQFSIDGLDDDSADDRSDEAEGEVWLDQSQWVSINLDTEMIVLNDASLDSEIHSPVDYTVVNPPVVILGDINGDGDINFNDIQPFIESITTSFHVPAADIDQSGNVDFLDIAPFIDLLRM